MSILFGDNWIADANFSFVGIRRTTVSEEGRTISDAEVSSLFELLPSP